MPDNNDVIKGILQSLEGLQTIMESLDDTKANVRLWQAINEAINEAKGILKNS